MCSVSRKTAGPFVGLVRADALEDARPVVQPVRADVNRRVGPVDELAVHPDLACLLHRGLLGRRTGSRNGTRRLSATDRRACRLGEAHQVHRREPGHVPRRAGADPDDLLEQELAVDEHALDVRSGNGATAPGSKPVAATTSSGARHARVAGARGRARSSPGPRAGRRERARARHARRRGRRAT